MLQKTSICAPKAPSQRLGHPHHQHTEHLPAGTHGTGQQLLSPRGSLAVTRIAPEEQPPHCSLGTPPWVGNHCSIITISLQDRFIKRCLMSISQQFCFVTRGPNAVLGEGAARLENAHLSRSWGAVEFPTQPHLALPQVFFFFPLGVPVHILHLIKRPAARSRPHISIPPELSELHR